MHVLFCDTDKHQNFRCVTCSNEMKYSNLRDTDDAGVYFTSDITKPILETFPDYSISRADIYLMKDANKIENGKTLAQCKTLADDKAYTAFMYDADPTQSNSENCYLYNVEKTKQPNTGNLSPLHLYVKRTGINIYKRSIHNKS